MKRFLVLLPCLAMQAHAQVDVKGEWHFPTSAKSYCSNLEQNILSTYKAMIEQNRLASNPDWTGDRRQAHELSAAMKAAIKENEESWHRMDCASILYLKK